MNIVQMYQCEHCRKKVAHYKKTIEKHEKICYYNPETHSCATCIWSGVFNTIGGAVCSLGLIDEAEAPFSVKFLTNCSQWKNRVLIELIDDDNEEMIIMAIVDGDEKAIAEFEKLVNEKSVI